MAKAFFAISQFFAVCFRVADGKELLCRLLADGKELADGKVADSSSENKKKSNKKKIGLTSLAPEILQIRFNPSHPARHGDSQVPH